MGGELEGLKEIWNEHFKHFLGDANINIRLIGIMESLAPYYALDTKYRKADVLSIDIGGGTTDVAIFSGGNLKGITSFKFAGNALFGDAYEEQGQGAEKNGFVCKFVDTFEKLLDRGYPRAAGILRELKKKGKADDINAFLFSVENNLDFWRRQDGLEQGKSANKDPYSYSIMIKTNGTDLKFLILYFYMALIYHVASLLKNMDEGISISFMTFSGTASKILKILTSDDKKISNLATEMFKQVGIDCKNLAIELVNEPKEATCKGGLRVSDDKAPSSNFKQKQLVYSCVHDGLAQAKYKDYLDDIAKKESLIEKSLMEFHGFFFKIDESMDFGETFNINTAVIGYVKDNYENLVHSWIEPGVTFALETLLGVNVSTEVSDEKTTEKNKKALDKVAQETPFFMPLVGIIQELSGKIANKEYE